MEGHMNTALQNLRYCRRYLHFYLYPILLKLLSDVYIPYDTFFTEKKAEYLAFIGLSENDRIAPQGAALPDDDTDSSNLSAAEKAILGDDDKTDAKQSDTKQDEDEKGNEDEKTEESVPASAGKSFEKGIETLELMFPEAGWNKLRDYPDLYPYFHSCMDLFKGSDMISPEDPALQVLILALIVQELLYGFRAIKYNTGEDDAKKDSLASILDEWNLVLSDCFDRLYIPQLTEYGQAIENSGGKVTEYISKIKNDIHWIRRSYFFPFYEFSAFGGPSFSKKDIRSLFRMARTLARELNSQIKAVAEALKTADEASKPAVDGIMNPWEPYTFDVENKVSRRLSKLLPKDKANNVSLIMFTFHVVVVLDYLMNNQASWAYNGADDNLVRDANSPTFATDKGKEIDAEAIFRKSLKERKTEG
jgi:hypothetical protein